MESSNGSNGTTGDTRYSNLRKAVVHSIYKHKPKLPRLHFADLIYPTWDAQINLAMYGANGVPLRQLSSVCTHTKLNSYLVFLGPFAKKCRIRNHWNLITWYLGHPRRRPGMAIDGQELTSFFFCDLPEQDTIRWQPSTKLEVRIEEIM